MMMLAVLSNKSKVPSAPAPPGKTAGAHVEPACSSRPAMNGGRQMVRFERAGARPGGLRFALFCFDH